jgi:hypothetical protein
MVFPAVFRKLCFQVFHPLCIPSLVGGVSGQHRAGNHAACRIHGHAGHQLPKIRAMIF